MKCRHCNADLNLTLVDLQTSPPSNSYLTDKALRSSERYYPLNVMVCEDCWLVQTEDFVSADEMFSADYAYFSNFSEIWKKHCSMFVDKVVDRFGLNSHCRVVEIASNDGCLLRLFKEKGILCTGVEPTSSTAEVAKSLGLDIVEDFFSSSLALSLVKDNKSADLIVANNVLAHVPDINDFIKGFKLLLKPTGISTFEFPHVLNLIEKNQFDTIYHEHFSYLSLVSVKTLLAFHGLEIFDVEELETHGGSLRVYCQHVDIGVHKKSESVEILIEKETKFGLKTKSCYMGFQNRVETLKYDFLNFLIDSKRNGKSVVGYGAAAKGNTLLNYAGVRSDLISFVVDKNPYKQNKFLPGSRIPIVDEHFLLEYKPDFIVIFPWNIKSEIIGQLSYCREWGAKFVTAIPHLTFE